MTQKCQRSDKTRTAYKFLTFPQCSSIDVSSHLSEDVTVDGLVRVGPAVDELEEVHARAVPLHHQLQQNYTQYGLYGTPW